MIKARYKGTIICEFQDFRRKKMNFYSYFLIVSQLVTHRPFLCSVNQKQQDNGNSLQDQVQALRSAVRALHAAGLWADADVRRLRRIRRNRNGHPVSGLPAAAQHHAGGVQRTGRGDLPLGLDRKKVAPETWKSPENYLSLKNNYLFQKRNDTAAGGGYGPRFQVHDPRR